MRDAPNNQEKLFTDLFRLCASRYHGNKKQKITPKDNSKIQLVPITLSHVLLKTSHSNPKSKVDADGDVEQKLHRNESWRVGDLEAVNDGGDDQENTCDEETYIEVLAVPWVVELLKDLIEFIMFDIQKGVGLFCV